MPPAGKLLLGLGALLAAAAVGLGAFGAHALRGRLSGQALDWWQTAVQYHFWHALGVIAIGLCLLHVPESRALRAAGALLVVGCVVFSGSLYALALSGERWLGAVTPLGGMTLIAGWLVFAWAVLRD